MKIEASKLEFDSSPLVKKLVETIRKVALTDIKSRHRANYEKGLTSKGEAQRDYSDSYKKAILAGKVPFKAKETSNRVTLRQKGDLLSSIQVVDTPTGGNLEFLGTHRSNQTNESLAKQLKAKKFKFHELSEEDKKATMRLMQKALVDGLRSVIKTKT